VYFSLNENPHGVILAFKSRLKTTHLKCVFIGLCEKPIRTDLSPGLPLPSPVPDPSINEDVW
jgi:hypothetical protein